jgi:release factor glutamine methyltransferase
VDAEQRFDLIVANPPYVPTGDVPNLMPDVRDFEPRLALDGGADGLTLVRRIVEDAPAHLRPGGRLAVEVGAGEADATVALFRARGFADVSVTRDYARVERVIDARFSAPG